MYESENGGCITVIAEWRVTEQGNTFRTKNIFIYFKCEIDLETHSKKKHVVMYRRLRVQISLRRCDRKRKEG
jgi:hypothetical protein